MFLLRGDSKTMRLHDFFLKKCKRFARTNVIIISNTAKYEEEK